MTWKLYGSDWKCFGRGIMTEKDKTCITMLAVFSVFMFLIVSFVREDFLLLGWKEAWFLLISKIDDNHVVT